MKVMIRTWKATGIQNIPSVRIDLQYLYLIFYVFQRNTEYSQSQNRSKIFIFILLSILEEYRIFLELEQIYNIHIYSFIYSRGIQNIPRVRIDLQYLYLFFYLFQRNAEYSQSQNRSTILYLFFYLFTITGKQYLILISNCEE